MNEAKRLQPFYSFSAGQRIENVRSAIQERRTLIERWKALGSAEAAPWNERAAHAAKMLGSQRSVVDIGCGNMQLERHLPDTCIYIPVDVVTRDKRTIVVDLNTERLPQLTASSYAILGVIEYLFDPIGLLERLSGTIVLSYNPTDFNSDHRIEHGWLNHLSKGGLEKMINGLGWTKVEELRLYHQVMWKYKC